MLPFTSLDAATAPGAGAVLDLQRVEKDFTVSTWAVGSPSSVTMTLQGSHDGTHWVNMGNLSVGDMFAAASGFLVRFVRVNLTAISGGTSPAVTATIAVAGDDPSD
jgi:hypothetical protein